jgi:hypothetical protein
MASQNPRSNGTVVGVGRSVGVANSQYEEMVSTDTAIFIAGRKQLLINQPNPGGRLE